MSSNALVAYSPNDFFYEQAGNHQLNCDTSVMVNGNVYITNGNTIIAGNSYPGYIDNGTTIKINDPNWDTICNDSGHTYWFSDNKMNCYNAELCKNKENAKKLMDLDSSGQATKEKYMNEKMNYDNVLMNSINLGIGIVFILYVIYKVQK